MNMPKINPKTDLVLEMTLDIPVEKVWEAWTTPAHMKHWFMPKPWQLVDARVDLRPGGEFYSDMRGPNGEAFSGSGCYLEVVKNEKLVWTDCLGPDFRPSNGNPFFTAMIILQRDGNKTKYKAIALHKDEETKQKHEQMGFMQGWAICANQLVDYMKSL